MTRSPRTRYAFLRCGHGSVEHSVASEKNEALFCSPSGWIIAGRQTKPENEKALHAFPVIAAWYSARGFCKAACVQSGGVRDGVPSETHSGGAFRLTDL